MRISINIPSYKRPYVETLDYLKHCDINVWVDPSEYDEYVSQNEGHKNGIIKKLPDGVQGNISRVRNYILDHEFLEEQNDVVVMLDDDMRDMGYYEVDSHKIESEDFMDFVYLKSILADDIGAKMWGVSVSSDRQNYREYTPFNIKNFVGGPFQAFLDNAGGLRYDEALFLKEDYDMTLQQLNKHRVVLRCQKYFYNTKQSENKGGCAVSRSFDEEVNQLKLLIKKWGSDIVKVDTHDRSNSLTKEKNKIDYNPIIKPKIKGV